MVHQIDTRLHERSGQAISNFQAILPAAESDLLQQTLKDPYVFDFVAMTDRHNGRELESQLVTHVEKFLLELGQGFAFVGRQVRLTIGGTDSLLCQSENNVVAEYALRGNSAPIGVAEWRTQIVDSLPEEFTSSLPSIELLEAELGEG